MLEENFSKKNKEMLKIKVVLTSTLTISIEAASHLNVLSAIMNSSPVFKGISDPFEKSLPLKTTPFDE